MTEGPQLKAAGPRGAPEPGALPDVDLLTHDWRGLIELPLAVYLDRLDDLSSNVYTSPRLDAVLGYTPEEWAGDDHLLLRVLHPDDRERGMAAHRRSCGTGELRAEAAAVSRNAQRNRRVQDVTRRTHRDGSLIDVELLAAPVLRHGEPLGTCAIYHDVRELKQAEERYARSSRGSRS